MPYVKRNDDGAITAVSHNGGDGFDEELSVQDSDLNAFVHGLGGQSADLQNTDLDFIRVVEDVIELLIAKNVILFTELPDSAQTKMMDRQKLRTALTSHLDLLEDDENFI
ncbi:MAG: hypothetical protein ACI89U_002920 [Gammaproteobacteria bacterium]|jgi:hypothetical protein